MLLVWVDDETKSTLVVFVLPVGGYSDFSGVKAGNRDGAIDDRAIKRMS